MPLDPGVLDSVNNSNFKALAESNAKSVSESNDFKTELSGLRVQMARTSADSYSRLALVAEKSIAEALSSWNTERVKEAVAIDKLLKSSAESSILADTSQTAAGQVAAKISQSTPGAESNITSTLAQLAAGQAALAAQVAAIQQFVKAAQSTPETAVPAAK